MFDCESKESQRPDLYTEPFVTNTDKTKKPHRPEQYERCNMTCQHCRWDSPNILTSFWTMHYITDASKLKKVFLKPGWYFPISQNFHNHSHLPPSCPTQTLHCHCCETKPNIWTCDTNPAVVTWRAHQPWVSVPREALQDFTMCSHVCVARETHQSIKKRCAANDLWCTLTEALVFWALTHLSHHITVPWRANLRQDNPWPA